MTPRDASPALTGDAGPGPTAYPGPADDAGAGETCAPGDTRPCYDGPPETLDIGVCRAGVQTCTPAGEFGLWGECFGQVTASETATGTCECSPENLEAGGAPVPDTSPALCGEMHTACDCGAAGGEWVDIGESCRICRFEGSECPESWTQLESWNTTATNTECPTFALEPSGTSECSFIDIPIVRTSTAAMQLSCDRRSDFCCGSPPDNSDGHLTAQGQAWSNHIPDETSWTQGYNRCGCACGSEHCTTTTALCRALITQIGCT